MYGATSAALNILGQLHEVHRKLTKKLNCSIFSSVVVKVAGTGRQKNTLSGVKFGNIFQF